MKNLVTTGGYAIPKSSLHFFAEGYHTPKVFFTSQITSEALLQVFHKLKCKPQGKIGIKLSTGEPPSSNYLRPELIKDLVQELNGTIVECNTAYGGARADNTHHLKTAEEHGFTKIAPFQLLDEEGSMPLPVENGNRLKENYVGKAFADYNFYVVLSHFKGHAMAGFGGAIKNISIGFASGESGKKHIHTAGTDCGIWEGEQLAFLESMADAAKSVSDFLDNGKRIVYINVMNRLSVDCDCDGHPAEPDMQDVGILASTDPLALDQACIDILLACPDSGALLERIRSRSGLHTLSAAYEIGLGSRKYNLEILDN